MYIFESIIPFLPLNLIISIYYKYIQYKEKCDHIIIYSSVTVVLVDAGAMQSQSSLLNSSIVALLVKSVGFSNLC